MQITVDVHEILKTVRCDLTIIIHELSKSSINFV